MSVAVAGGVGDAIPREYHRRVLKKIAQLTKVRRGGAEVYGTDCSPCVQVVYALNTRNEEHESLIAALRATYEERARRAESSAAARLREMGEKVRDACEEGEKRVKEMKRKMEAEREQLTQSQVGLSYELYLLVLFHTLCRLSTRERLKRD